MDTYLEGSLENETLATYIQEKNTNTPDTYDTEVLADVRDAIGDLRDDSITDLNAAITVSGTINKSRSDSFNSAIIEEQRDILEADLAEKTGAAAEVEGLQSAVGTLTSAEASFNDAKDALAAAATAVESEYAKAGILNGNTATDISETLNYPSTSAEVAGLEYDAVTPTNNVLVESAADGALIVINEDDDVVIAEGKANYAGISALYDAVVAEFNAIVAEQNAQNSFETALAGVLAAENPEIELADAVTLTDAATTSPVTLGDGLYRDSDGTVYAFEKGGSNSGTSLEDGDSVYEVISYQVPNLDGSAATVTIGSAVTGVTAADYTAVAAATNNTVTVDTNANDLDVASYFNETTDSDGDGVSNEVGYTGTGGAIKDAPVASALAESQDTLATFEEAVSAYLEAKQLSEGLAKVDKAATDARAAIEDSEEDGGLGINLLGLGDSVTSGDDLILFAEDEGTTTTISNFGAQGEDSIYFGGDFSLVALGDSSITDRVGDVSANEIFWEEDATGLTLYVEADAAAGFDRDGVAQDQMTTIKLAGVSFDDITFEGGYLTAGEVA